MNNDNVLTEQIISQLIEQAKSISANAYATYSGYSVGAALLTKDGKIFKGTNVENASYGLSICAERVAIGNMVTHGYTKGDILAIAIYGGNGKDISPCGTCRQFIYEFEDGQDIQVFLKNDGQYIQVPIKTLVPYGFNKH